MKYTTRTCSTCGVRLPQPDMHKVQISVQTGSSKRGVTAREFVGFFVGSSKSANSLGNWLFSPNLRKYTRNQTVWKCSNCAGASDGRVLGGATSSFSNSHLKYFAAAAFILIGVSLIANFLEAVNLIDTYAEKECKKKFAMLTGDFSERIPFDTLFSTFDEMSRLSSTKTSVSGEPLIERWKELRCEVTLLNGDAFLIKDNVNDDPSNLFFQQIHH